MHTSKVHLLQSIISRILVECVLDAYFIGLSKEQTAQFMETESLLSSLGKSHAERFYPIAATAKENETSVKGARMES